MAFTRIGFGQIEENQMSAPKNGQIFASLPLDEKVTTLQNGEFMYYSYADGMVTAEPVKGKLMEPMLVYNEVKIYEDYLAHKDFAMIRVGGNYVTSRPAVGRVTSANTNGAIYGQGSLTENAEIDPEHTEYPYGLDGIAPRLWKTAVGDIYTTNMVKTGVDYAVGDMLVPALNEESHTLVLEKSESTDGMVWMVVKVYTMPDGQPGLKLQRVQ